MKQKFGDIVIQIIPVMIGVFLGFAVSNWAEGRKNRNQTELLKTNIIAEIQANKKTIERVVDYHAMVRDSSRSKAYTRTEAKLPAFFKGVRTSILIDSAFETAIQTGLINGFSFEQIQEVNTVYTFQDAYNEYSTILLSGLITLDIPENEQGLRKFYRFLSISMTDIVIKENELLSQYDQLLEILK